jgi:hypothetical protein
MGRATFSLETVVQKTESGMRPSRGMVVMVMPREGS